MNEITCEKCAYADRCPVMWSYNNAACLTIRKEKEKDGKNRPTK